MPPQRTNMKFYSVANGVKIDVYTEWSTCELNVNNFNHAVYKGFKTIDEAIYFLFDGNVPRQESRRSCMYVLGVSILPL
jgi:viroplasmin and RNaseH domain-containing protein